MKRDSDLPKEVKDRQKKLCIELVGGKTRRLELLVSDDDINFLDEIAKKESRSRRQVANIIFANMIQKKRNNKDLTLEI